MIKPARLISYRWALDSKGYPTPIEAAQRTEEYTCPLCHGIMIPRLGDQNQHHFGHEDLTDCTPESVNRAAIRCWIGFQLRGALAKNAAVTWSCNKCGGKRQHQANLLQGVTRYEESYTYKGIYLDIALFEGDKVRAALIVQDTLEDAGVLVDREMFTILIPPGIMSNMLNFAQMIQRSQVLSGPCPVLASIPNFVREGELIKHVLREAVAKFPGYVYRPVEMIHGVQVVKVDHYALWLTPERWENLIGGTRNRLGHGVNISAQTWVHTDGGTINLFYVMVRDTEAIGVRRYAPGAAPTAHVDGRIQYRNTTALDVARYLVTK